MPLANRLDSIVIKQKRRYDRQTELEKRARTIATHRAKCEQKRLTIDRTKKMKKELRAGHWKKRVLEEANSGYRNHILSFQLDRYESSFKDWLMEYFGKFGFKIEISTHYEDTRLKLMW